MIDDNLRRFVLGHVDDLRVGGADADRALLHLHHLPLIAAQIAGRLRLRAELANRGNDIGLLDDHCLAEALGPRQIAVHHIDHVGVVEQGDHRIVPTVVGRQGGIAAHRVEVTGGLHDLQGIGRGRQNDADEVVGVERDRCHQLGELGWRQKLATVGIAGGVAGRWRGDARLLIAGWGGLIVLREGGILSTGRQRREREWQQQGQQRAVPREAVGGR